MLGTDLFANDKALEEVYFPLSLKSSEKIFDRNNSLKALNFDGFIEQYPDIFAAEGESLEDHMIKESWKETEEYFDVLKDLKVTYGYALSSSRPFQESPSSPTLDPEPVVDPKADLVSGVLLGVTLVCFILTGVSLTIFVRRALGIAVKKKEAALKEEKEGFHPQVLGVWECKKCGTPNSPIANYCYKCGRKGEH